MNGQNIETLVAAAFSVGYGYWLAFTTPTKAISPSLELWSPRARKPIGIFMLVVGALLVVQAFV